MAKDSKKKASPKDAKGKKGKKDAKKKGAHPEMHEVDVTCACGASFKTLSTMKTIKVEICSQCHPFFTGKQKFVDTAGRVERFRQKFGDAVPVPRKKKKKGAEDEEAKRQVIHAKS